MFLKKKTQIIDYFGPFLISIIAVFICFVFVSLIGLEAFAFIMFSPIFLLLVVYMNYFLVRNSNLMLQYYAIALWLISLVNLRFSIWVYDVDLSYHFVKVFGIRVYDTLENQNMMLVFFLLSLIYFAVSNVFIVNVVLHHKKKIEWLQRVLSLGFLLLLLNIFFMVVI